MRASPRSLQIRPFVATLGAITLLLVGTTSTALAQAEPPPSAPPPVTVTSGGNGIGVGAAAFLSGVGGVQVDYDTPMWDADAILGFSDRSTGGNNSQSQTQIQFGVQGWYHLHRGSSSDFSVGGGVGIDHVTGGGPNATATQIEVGARPRAFITSNVAVHAMLGVTITVGDNGVGGADNKGVGIGAQPLFGFGFTYYFK